MLGFDRSCCQIRPNRYVAALTCAPMFPGVCRMWAAGGSGTFGRTANGRRRHWIPNLAVTPVPRQPCLNGCNGKSEESCLAGAILTLASTFVQQRHDIPRGDPIELLDYINGRLWLGTALAGVFAMLSWGAAFLLIGRSLPEPTSRVIAQRSPVNRPDIRTRMEAAAGRW